jgi:hypothetical protein
MVQVRPRSHLQPIRDPLHGHDCLFPQLQSNFNFDQIAFWTLAMPSIGDADAGQFLLFSSGFYSATLIAVLLSPNLKPTVDSFPNNLVVLPSVANVIK